MADALAVTGSGGREHFDLLRRVSTRRKTHLMMVNEMEPGANPDREVTRKIIISIGLALIAQAIGCLFLQLLLPDPVRVFPRMAVGREMVPLFTSHLLATYIIAGLYLVVCSPLLLYVLWNVKDANGIKKQIVTTLVLGTPLFVIWFILLFVKTGPLGSLKEFIPAPYLPYVLFLVAHITSIVIPLIKSYTTETPSRLKAWTPLKKADSEKTLLYSPSQPRTSRLYPWRKLDSLSRAESQDVRNKEGWLKKFRLGSKQRSGEGYPTSLKLTESDFRRVLEDAQLFPSFKKFSAADFSIEAAVFHESHVFLRRAIHLLVESGSLPSCGTLQVTDEDIAAASGRRQGDTISPRGAVVGQFCYIWETFVKVGALMEVKELSKDARERVEEGLSSGIYSPDIFDEVAEENFKIMFENVYPKFLLFHNSNCRAL
ncbi:hypothetical protein HDU67_004721 [Dinochytrium kinnereticum]|nr:hypothetical protein HDU67_004721 [Dinochytrium kinnereticum]